MSLNLENYYAGLDEQNDPWDSVECKEQDQNMWFEFDEINTMNYEQLYRLHMALTICERCPMKLQCLERGLDEGDIDYGIWGGLFPGERLKLKGPIKYEHERRKLYKAGQLRKQIAEIIVKNQRHIDNGKRWKAKWEKYTPSAS